MNFFCKINAILIALLLAFGPGVVGAQKSEIPNGRIVVCGTFTQHTDSAVLELKSDGSRIHVQLVLAPKVEPVNGAACLASRAITNLNTSGFPGGLRMTAYAGRFLGNISGAREEFRKTFEHVQVCGKVVIKNGELAIQFGTDPTRIVYLPASEVTRKFKRPEIEKSPWCAIGKRLPNPLAPSDRLSMEVFDFVLDWPRSGRSGFSVGN
jgi:hypothetical protein